MLIYSLEMLFLFYPSIPQIIQCVNLYEIRGLEELNWINHHIVSPNINHVLFKKINKSDRAAQYINSISQTQRGVLHELKQELTVIRKLSYATIRNILSAQNQFTNQYNNR